MNLNDSGDPLHVSSGKCLKKIRIFPLESREEV